MKRVRDFLMCVCLLVMVACSTSTVNTPGGHSSNTTFFGGLYSSSNLDTNVAETHCREMLKPGHPGEQPMIDREVFAQCYSVAMAGVEPRGQQAPPIPVDLDGDGRPDAVRYPNGLQVPYGMYSMYPGYNWNQMYQFYGGGLGMSMGQGMGPLGYNVAPPGASEDQGGILDPSLAYARRAPSRTAYASAQDGDNTGLRAVAGQVAQNTREIHDIDTELQQHLHEHGSTSTPPAKARRTAPPSDVPVVP